MKNFFKILFISMLIAAAFVVPVVIALSFGMSALPGVLFSSTVISLFLIYKLIRFTWQRRREKKFIDGILEKENGALSGDKELSGELAKRWKEAMRDLKKSHLKHLGNPLYVLPWYMLIGESGSGKTTAITNSGLNSKFSTPKKVSGVSGTKNCDWWFFEQAIIVDTAGRYSIHQDEAADSGEWRLFLRQLAKYRKKEPLNGLIITVSAEKLLNSPSGEIEKEGAAIRVRIEELTHSLGAKFPVYVLVTKCDLINGMKQFCDLLPETAHNQAFGYLNDQSSDDTTSIIGKALKTISEKIRNYRLRLTNLPGREEVPTEVLLFPEEFSTLKKGLEKFTDAAFNKSIYQEIPVLRGIYFTSGHQSGEAYSHFIKQFGFSLDSKEQIPADKSYFLFDFFSKILPSDRGLFSLTKRAEEWKRKIKLTKLSAWGVSVFALCVFLTWSFWVNLVTIKNFQKELSDPKVISGELLTDLDTLEDLRQSVLKIERQNNINWLPNLGLNHTGQIEKNLKKLYCNLFLNDFLNTYDKKLTESVIDYSINTPGTILGQTIPHYAKRINLLEASLVTDTLPELSKTPIPDFDILIGSKNQSIIPKSLELIENQYLHYLIWATGKEKADEIKKLRSSLEFLANKKEISMKWLISWCNENTDISPVTHKDFWQGKKKNEKGAIVEPAFTVRGFEQIEQMITELESALEVPLNIEKKKNSFRQWYKDKYIEKWFHFGDSFQEGIKTLNDDADKLAVSKMIAAGNGPYLSLLDRMAVELSPCFESSIETPLWMKLVFQLDEIRDYADEAATADNSGVMGKFAKKGIKLLGKAGKVAKGVNKTNSGSAEFLMTSADGYNRYLKGLSGISTAALSPVSSYTLATAAFSEDPVSGESDVLIAKRGLEDLKTALLNKSTSHKMFNRLLGGPLEYIWGYVCQKTGCHVQGVWDETVLSEVEGVYNPKALANLLFGEKGLVNNFTAGDVSPFIARSRKKGFYAKTVAGERVPFSKTFLTYLTKGTFSDKSEEAIYKVELRALPTDTNTGAKLIPHVTKLEMECAEGVQALENFNYPVRKKFIWSPKVCGDVSLKIHVGNLVLEKKYTGFRPFAKFLKDFSKGYHTFKRSAFTENRAALKRLGIKYIKVKYKISGAGPVLRLLEMSAGNAPEVIVSCSD